MLLSGSISEIALIFATPNAFNSQVNRALAILGKQLRVSRSYLFIDSPDGSTTCNTHEWCAEGIEPQMVNLQNIPYTRIPSWKTILETGQVCAVASIASMPRDIRNILEPQGILSVILAPLRIDGRIQAFLGCDECTSPREWTVPEIETLKIVSGIITTAYSSSILAERLNAAQENFRGFADTAQDYIVIADSHGRIVSANQAACQKLGYSLDELRERPLTDLYPQDRRQETETVLQAMFEKKQSSSRLDMVSRHGQTIPAQTRIWSGLWDNRPHTFIISRDLSAHIELQRELESARNRLTNIIDATRLGTWEWNIQNGEVKYNNRWAEIIGYTLEEISPIDADSYPRFAHPDDLAESDRLIRLHIDGITPYYECESRLRHKNGSWVWVLDRGKVSEWDNQGRPHKMYGTHSDITSRKAMEEQIRELAIRDPLTDVFNRRYIFQRLSEICAEYSRQGRNFCVSIIDLDHFKKINDRYGHQAGDFVLREFIQTIKATTRQYDLIGRYGGEEFIVISPSAGRKEIAMMFERIMERIRNMVFNYQGHELQLTFSCGIADSAEFTRAEMAIETIIGLADQRMYQAKAIGRDNFI